MESYILKFGRINILGSDIGELIVDEGIEMTMDMVEKCHNCLLANLEIPFALLVNKIHSYAYSFPAQRNFAAIPQISAVALVAYSPIAVKSIESLLQVPRNNDCKLEIFTERYLALQWLQEEQDRLKGYDRDKGEVCFGL